MGSSFEREKPSIDESAYTLLNDNVEKHRCPSCQTWPRRSLILNAVGLILNLALLSFLSLILLTRSSVPASFAQPEKLHEVVLKSHEFTDPAIQYEVETFRDAAGLFRGEAREELDLAWADLLKDFTVRVPAATWQQPTSPNYTMVELTDGSGDRIATPAFLHDIHCLRSIREYLLPEDYPRRHEQFKPTPPNRMSAHLDHCLDMLRQSVMCHADMTLYTYEWRPEIEIPKMITHRPHVCANWEHLTNWVGDRSVHLKGGIIKHAFTGVVPDFANT